MKKRIVVVGSINLDLVASAERVPVAGETISGKTFQTFFGGKGANQAVAAARLRHPVSMLGKVGEDAFGPQLRKALRDAGVDVKAVESVKGASGVALIATGSKGENSIIVVPGANGQLLPRDLDRHKPLLRTAGVVLTQLETPLETIEYLGQLAKRFDVPLMLDPAPARSLPPELMMCITWLTPNETETRMLLGSAQDVEPARAADELLRRGARNLVLKLGEKGAYLATSDGKRTHVPAFPVRAVDTTAAGDAFNGAFAVALMQGKSVLESVRYGCAVAALSVTQAGAQPSLPTRAQAQRFLKQQDQKKSASAGWFIG